MNKKFRSDLDVIREVLGPDSTDDEAAGLAVQTMADHFRTGRLVMTQTDLENSMIGYATHALERHTGEKFRPIRLPGGQIGFEATGEPATDSHAPPVH